MCFYTTHLNNQILKMKIQIINGPNLNLLGVREKSIYGNSGFEPFLETLRVKYDIIQIDYLQSNVEGELINKLHEVGFTYDGIVINAGGYTHTSVAIADAIAAINTPVVEVHISNIYAREEYRHVSLTGKNCKGVLTGFGLDGYRLALESFLL
jgi:3-dehydroquinate dehydratase-2